MNLNISGLRCSAQVALLGAITPNIRAINVVFNSALINLNFYYDLSPSEEEEDIAEVVATEVMSSFINVRVEANKFTIPYPQPLPIEGIRVFHRWEK